MKTLTFSLFAVLAIGCTDKPTDDTGTPSTDDRDVDGYTVADGDCDDGDAQVNPGESEVWYDGIDQDCDTNDADQDLDGFPVGDDCDDLDAAVNPDGVEVCDEVDNDCDGEVDVGADDSAVAYPDADADGHGRADGELVYCGTVPAGYATLADDCDDAQPTVFPGADEVCDDLDNDCDGAINEGNPDQVPYYRDADADGYGTAGDSVLSCVTPEGYVADATDCDDASAEVYPAADEYCDALDRDCDGQATNDPVDGTAYYADADLDTYGDAATERLSCEVLDGLVTDGADCDDTNGAINPAAAEVCDGLDNDCSAVADDGLPFSDWYADADADGSGDAAVSASACEQPSGYVADATDCDDADALTYVGAEEVCDLEDNDCDGAVDDSAVDERTYYDDADSDGYGNAGVSVSSCGAPSGYAETGDDCDDGNSLINPGEAESCNGLDDDCDAETDEDALDASTWYRDADRDTYGDDADTSLACDRPSGYIAVAGDCDDANAATSPDGAEVCDSADNDCDGTTDEDSAADAVTWFLDGDGDGYGLAGSTYAACVVPAGYAAVGTDCDDGAAAVSPAAVELCNGLDDDCDASVDESGATGESTWYIDADGDGYGSAASSIQACDLPAGYDDDTDDCDDADGASYPAGPEADDLADNDCDGWVDEDFVVAGDVIVSEITRQPRFGATVVNTNGQWFELHNTSTRDIDLSNWYVQRAATTTDAFYVDPDDEVVLGAGEYAVFCKTSTYTAASTASSTLVCDYVWGDPAEVSTWSGTYHDNTFSLQTNEDTLSVWVGGNASTGTLVDDVHWTYSSSGYWPRDATRAMNLDPAALDGASNDGLANWCSTTNSSLYRWYYVSASNAEYGTPGSANYDCP